VLRRAIHLVLESEPAGVHRDARIARLARALVAVRQDDAWAHLALAHALRQLGERGPASERFAAVAQITPGSALGAEALRARLAVDDPQAALEIDSVLRAACSAPAVDLLTIGARAARLGANGKSWVALLAAGIARRRLEDHPGARRSLEEALAIAPGATPVHVELASVLAALGDTSRAVEHAEKARELEGDTARAHAVLAAALVAARRFDEAKRAIARSLELDPHDEAHRALAERIHGSPRRERFFQRMRARLRGSSKK
jgi:tetratricopeptide (TPR) repeat protein